MFNIKKYIKHIPVPIKGIIIAIILFFLVSFSFFFWWIQTHTEVIPIKSYIGNIEITKVSREGLINLFQYNFNTIDFHIKDEVFPVDMDQIHYADMLGQSWDDIMNSFNDTSLIRAYLMWLRSYISPVVFEDIVFDESVLFSRSDLDAWVASEILQGVFDGGIIYKNSYQDIVVESPQSGEYIDLVQAQKELKKVLLKHEEAFVIEVQSRQALYTKSDIESFIENIDLFYEEGINMVHPGDSAVRYVLQKDELFNIVNLYPSTEKKNEFDIVIDDGALRTALDHFKAKDAQIILDENNNVQVVPSQNGVIPDYFRTKDNFIQAVQDHNKEFTVVPVGYTTAQFSTADVQQTPLDHLVSSFTTYHDCCAARVDNIQLVADRLDGHVLNPGEILSMNTFLGERTKESGFKSAGSIFQGELVDSVGGGISQFITTLHNAVYWGGYEIVDHKPHSIYFSRYPEGVEATINWPYLDYVFKNDSDTPIMIDTEYTDTSITINILGYNYGRVFVGEQKNGITVKNITGTSGEARQVVSHVSDRYNYKPPIVRYVSDLSLVQGQQVMVKQGGKGWRVDVSRRVIQGGKDIHKDEYPVYYRSARDTVIRVHPCDNPAEYHSYCYTQ